MISSSFSGKKTGSRQQQQQQILVLKNKFSRTSVTFRKSLIMSSALAKVLSTISMRKNTEEKPSSSKRTKTKLIHEKKTIHNSRKKSKHQKWTKFPIEDIKPTSAVEVPPINKSKSNQKVSRSYSDVVGHTNFSSALARNKKQFSTKKWDKHTPIIPLVHKHNILNDQPPHESNLRKCLPVKETNEIAMTATPILLDASEDQEAAGTSKTTYQSEVMLFEQENTDDNLDIGNKSIDNDFEEQMSRSREKSICNDVSYQMSYLSRNIKKLKEHIYDPLKTVFKLDIPIWNFIGVDEGPEIYPRFSQHFTDESYLMVEDFAKIAYKLARGNY